MSEYDESKGRRDGGVFRGKGRGVSVYTKFCIILDCQRSTLHQLAFLCQRQDSLLFSIFTHLDRVLYPHRIRSLSFGCKPQSMCPVRVFCVWCLVILTPIRNNFVNLLLLRVRLLLFLLTANLKAAICVQRAMRFVVVVALTCCYDAIPPLC